MSDHDELDGQVGESIADSSHAAHKPLQGPEGSRPCNAEGLSGIALVRAMGIKPAEPQRIDTTNIEAELEARPVIRR